MNAYPNLFSPWNLGSVRLRNRLAHASILTHYAKDGKPTQKLLNYLSGRAKGGAGLIVTEPLAMLSRVPPSNRVHAFHDSSIPELEKLVDAVELYDTRLIGQIQDPGRGRHEIGRNDAAIGASPLPDDLSWTVPHALSSHEIQQLIDEWSDSCLRLQQAGFSGVEISAGHGHIFHQFLSPHANRRGDQYGGDIDGRTLFLMELLKRIREKCGTPFIVGVKLVASDSVKGSIDIDEGRRIAKKISEVDLFDYWTFVWGSHSNSLWQHLPGAEGPRAPYLSQIKKLRDVAPSIKAGALGYITDPNEAERALSDGTADIIFLGRALIADAAWGEKALRGQEDQIRYCVSCNTCWRMTVESGGMACDNNPYLGLQGEALWRPKKAQKPLKIVVVGAGVAGLEAAWVAAARDHVVTLLGGVNGFGGKTRLHASLPGAENLSSVYDYQFTAGKREGVDYVFEKNASLEMILSFEPDRVLLATGATMAIPEFIPDEYIQDRLISDLRAFIADIKPKTFKEPGGVVIFDSDHTEMTYAAAELLTERFSEVIIITPRDRIASDCSLINRQKIYAKLYRKGVKLISDHHVLDLGGLDNGKVTLQNIYNGEARELCGIAALTYSTSRLPNDQLMEPSKSAGLEVISVGDCFAPRSLLSATAQGFSIGCQI